MTKRRQREIAEKWATILRPLQERNDEEVLALACLSEELYFAGQERMNQ